MIKAWYTIRQFYRDARDLTDIKKKLADANDEIGHLRNQIKNRDNIIDHERSTILTLEKQYKDVLRERNELRQERVKVIG